MKGFMKIFVSNKRVTYNTNLVVFFKNYPFRAELNTAFAGKTLISYSASNHTKSSFRNKIRKKKSVPAISHGNAF